MIRPRSANCCGVECPRTKRSNSSRSTALSTMGSADRAMAPSAASRSVIIASLEPSLTAPAESPRGLPKAVTRWVAHFRRPELELRHRDTRVKLAHDELLLYFEY